MPLSNLFSADYFAAKQHARVAKLKPQDFEEWDSARERYITEKIEPMLATYRQSDQDWFSDWNRRKGEVIHSSDLIFRLQKLNPHIFIQNQINFPDDWGLYLSACGRIQFLTGLPKGWLTEFSYALLDDRDLPVEEKRGWRTVLVYAMMKGAISWEDTIQEFGEPTDGWNEQRWQEALADFRHGGEQMVQRNIANIVEPVV